MVRLCQVGVLCHSVDLLDVAVALVIILCIFMCIVSMHLLLRPSRLEANCICTFTCKLCNEIEVQSNLILQHPSFYIYITSDDGYVCLCCQTGRSSEVLESYTMPRQNIPVT